MLGTLSRIVIGLALLTARIPDALPPAAARAIADEAPANGDPMHPRIDLLGADGIDWATHRAIEAAVAEGARRGLPLEHCRIWATRSEKRLIVSLGNPNPSGRWKGCPPGPCRPCLAVELSEDGTRILRSSYEK